MKNPDVKHDKKAAENPAEAVFNDPVMI